MTTDTFATALRQAREESGLSQPQLAALSGYNHSHISRLENPVPHNGKGSGGRKPTRDCVLSLAAGLSADWLLRDRLLVAAGFMPQDARIQAIVQTALELGR